MRPLDGLFLDFYGTLVGGDRAAVESACRRVVDDLKLPLTPEQLAIDWGKGYFALSEVCNDGRFRTLHAIECDSLVDTLRPYVGEIDPEPYVTTLHDWLVAPPVFEETLEVLALLRERGIPLCLVSNADHDDLLAAMEHTGIRADTIVTSESARSYKPHAAIFREALAQTGWSAERVLHAGDSLHSDVGGAAALGIGAVWVCRDVRISDIGTARPDYQVRDLRGLAELAVAARRGS